MADPMAQLQANALPRWTQTTFPAGAYPGTSNKTTQGVRIELSNVVIKDWNGSNCRSNAGGGVFFDVEKIKNRLLHYIRTYCATGTTKNQHSTKPHILAMVPGAQSPYPMVHLTVTEGARSATDSVPGCYDLPTANPAPRNGDLIEHFLLF